MVRLNYSFNFERVTPWYSDVKLSNGVFLWVWHADKIPPHVGCSFGGEYYSLKVNGKDEKLPVESVLQVIIGKKIPTFIIEIKTIDHLEIGDSFGNYKAAQESVATCIDPILKWLRMPVEVKKLSDLLQHLHNRNEISRVYSLNLNPEFRGILNYSENEIQLRLKQLQNAQRK